VQNNSTPSKEIIHNILRREVHNIVQGVPMIGVFEGLIVNYIITAIDPYIDAFTGENQKVDINQLSSYANYEVNNKIAKFKEVYQKELNEYE
jgi:hypothetical protein